VAANVWLPVVVYALDCHWEVRRVNAEITAALNIATMDAGNPGGVAEEA
jgi:hypothetical protein